MLYKVEFEVRDNELDIQNVVSNINYHVYTQHTRHQFLLEVLKIDFAEMTKANQLLILISSFIEFKKPLLSKKKFYVTCKIIPKGKIRFAFEQEIRLFEDDSLIAKATYIGVCMDGNRNRPYVPDSITQFINQNS